MNQQSQGSRGGIDWEAIRRRGELFPAEAMEFVREGLAHTMGMRGGRGDAGGRQRSRHVTGRELCEGLRELAIERYGLLARTVLRRWGILRTEDFGAIVYAMIDRGELRAGEDDSIEHFRAVYDFEDAFPEGG